MITREMAEAVKTRMRGKLPPDQAEAACRFVDLAVEYSVDPGNPDDSYKYTACAILVTLAAAIEAGEEAMMAFAEMATVIAIKCAGKRARDEMDDIRRKAQYN